MSTPPGSCSRYSSPGVWPSASSPVSTPGSPRQPIGRWRSLRQWASCFLSSSTKCPMRQWRKVLVCRSGITLFIFGGVAEMHSEPTSALSEFLMALAGPVASAVLGLLFFLLFGFVASSQGPAAVAGVLWYLSCLNWTLAAFNLVPAFPLDGGRMLRAALWGWRKDLIWATSIAAGAGNIFGILLIVLGLIEVLRGDFVGGVWLSLIGLFLRGAASATYEQTLARQILAGHPVSRFMNRRPITVSPERSVRELVEDYVYRYHHKVLPVVRD